MGVRGERSGITESMESDIVFGERCRTVEFGEKLDQWVGSPSADGGDLRSQLRFRIAVAAAAQVEFRSGGAEVELGGFVREKRGK